MLMLYLLHFEFIFQFFYLYSSQNFGILINFDSFKKYVLSAPLTI